MTDYIVKKNRGDADDVDINSDDVDITAQPTYVVDDLYKRSYGPTIYPQDVIAKGPWVDVRSFGASGSAQQTTGTIATGTTSLVLTDAKDFSNGMGIRIDGAGASGADLVTTIESGGGTTTPVLADAASTTVSSVTVDHDDSIAFQAAINAVILTDNKNIFVPGGVYNLATKISLPSSDLDIVGIGFPIINVTSGGIAFEQTNHNVLTRFIGLKFTGAGIGIKYIMEELSNTYYEYEISHCYFEHDAGYYGIHLENAREGKISNCFFEGGSVSWSGGNGIYSKKTVGTHVSQCDFHSCNIGIFQDGAASSKSAGLSLNQVSMLGCDEAVKIDQADDFRMVNSNIDYNNYSVQLLGVNRARISGCFIAGTNLDDNPALIMDDSTERTQLVSVSDCLFQGYYDAANTYDTVYLNHTKNCHFTDCNFTFYTRYGLSIGGTDIHLRVTNCTFAPRSTFGVNSIYTRDTDNSTSQVTG